MITAIFYFFAAVLVFAGVQVISVRNPVYAALFLVLAFFSCAGIWLILHAEFLAITLVLVYVGAVMVLFLFVVMMLNINLVSLNEGFTRYVPVGLLVGILVFIEMFLVLRAQNFGLDKYPLPTQLVTNTDPNTVLLGRALYTDYVYPFEIAAAILLVAMVAAIALTMRSSRHTHSQKPDKQVQIRREDRIRIVKMSAETPDS